MKIVCYLRIIGIDNNHISCSDITMHPLQIQLVSKLNLVLL